MAALRRFWPHALILAAVIAAYGGVTAFDVVRWDDPQLVTENILVRNFSPAVWWTYDPELYIPLTFLSFQIQYALQGWNAAAFHAGNLLLHALNALLVFGLLRLLLRERSIAVLGAILFAIHPLHAEAVSWISARKELLMTTFTLASLVAYLRSKEDAAHATHHRMFSILFALLALLSKATAIVIPALLVLFDAWGMGRITARSVVRKWPFWLLAIAFGIIAIFGRGDAATLLSPLEVFLLAFQSTAFYLEKFLAPTGLSAIHPATLPLGADPAAIAVVVAMAALGWILRRRVPSFALGIGWFLVALIPSFIAYQKTNDVTLAAERYAYLPSIGLILALCAVLARIIPERMTMAAALSLSVCLGVVLIPLARAQSATWSTTETLFQNVLRWYPASHVAKNNIAYLRLNEGKFEEAVKLASEAVIAKPSYADAWVNVGAALGRMNRLAEAERALQTAIAQDPRHAQAYFNIGGVQSIRGDWEAAAAAYRETVRLKPAHAAGYFRLALALQQLGQIDGARDAYAKAVALEPAYAGKIEGLDQ